MEKSSFVRNILGDFLFYKFIKAKKKEWMDYKNNCKAEDSISEWEIANYFYKL